LDYLSRGWSALPLCPPDHAGLAADHAERCGSPGKCPLGAWKRFQERLPSPKALRDVWGRFPNCNVGIVLGAVSRLVGLDVDGPQAEAVLRELSAGDLPLTLSFPTPGGGLRLLYALPEGVVVPRRRFDQGGSHLIVLGEGTLTVMPPSVHKSGKVYESFSTSAELQPAPAWLLQLGAAGNGQAGGAADDLLRPGTVVGSPPYEKARRYVGKCEPAISG
jgi:hypothetical protein